MEIKIAEFMTSVADASHLPADGIVEIAVAGKSNVGKSSFINTMTRRNKLAKTSSEPGRTRLLNYFSINNDEFRLVDLPGYGFARVPNAEKVKWAKLMEDYFRESDSLKHVIVLVDIRHDPSPLDKQMIAYLYHYSVPFTVVATKSDKLSATRASEARKNIADNLALGQENILLFSSLKKSGREDVLDRLESVLNAAKLAGEATNDDNIDTIDGN